MNYLSYVIVVIFRNTKYILGNAIIFEICKKRIKTTRILLQNLKLVIRQTSNYSYQFQLVNNMGCSFNPYRKFPLDETYATTLFFYNDFGNIIQFGVNETYATYAICFVIILSYILLIALTLFIIANRVCINTDCL